LGTMKKYKNYLVTGPESSATRMVSKFTAASLGLIKSVDDWNGN